MQKRGCEFEEANDEAAFYGPKIEAHLLDSQGRDWQMGTAQLDLVMLAKQFETHYIDEDSIKKMPWVIHRAVFGTFERFIAVMLEHTDGTLPLWLSPVQAKVLYVSDDERAYAEEVVGALHHAGVRAELDTQNATLGKKIRAAEVLRIPVIAVIGAKEVAVRTVSVRNDVKSFDDFIADIAKAARIPTI